MPHKNINNRDEEVKERITLFYSHPLTLRIVYRSLLHLLSHYSQNEGIRSKKNYDKETFISLSPKYGHKFVYTTIDGIPTTFMLDTGASTSTVSQTYLNRLIRSGFVNRYTHFIRNGNYITANGNVVNAEVWQLPSMTMGPKTIYNIEIAVMPGIDQDGFLLGMSTINKLGNPTIDLTNNKIIIK